MGDRRNFRRGIKNALRSPRNVRVSRYRWIGRLGLFGEVRCPETTTRLDRGTGGSVKRISQDCGTEAPRVAPGTHYLKLAYDLPIACREGWRVRSDIGIRRRIRSASAETISTPRASGAVFGSKPRSCSTELILAEAVDIRIQDPTNQVFHSTRDGFCLNHSRVSLALLSGGNTG